MKSEAQSSQKNHLNAQTLLASLEQDLKLPIHLNQQILTTLRRHKQLKHKNQKQQKLNQFKDQVLENVVSMFQAKQAKILNRLKALQEINLKYMQRYLQAKKKSSKSRNRNISLLVQSVDKGKTQKKNEEKLYSSQERSLNNHQQRGVNQSQQREMSMKSNEDSVDLSMVQMTESIFNTQQWLEMIKQSEEKLISIENQDNAQFKSKQENQEQNSTGQTLAKVLLKCMDNYCFQKSKDKQSEERSFYTKKVQELIEIKKTQVQENQSLKANIHLNSDLKRLKALLDKVIAFEKQIKHLRTLVISSKQVNSTKTKQLTLIVLEQKVEIENLIEAQISSIQNYKLLSAKDDELLSNDKPQKFSSFKQRQKQVFKKICHQIMSQLQRQNESHFLNKLIRTIDQKNNSNESFIQTKLKSLEKYVTQIENQSKQQKQCISRLKEQNQQISKNLSQLQMMKDKYDFYINQMANKSNKSIMNVSQQQPSAKPSKISLKLDQMISRQYYQKQKQLLRECLARKDQLLTIQQQQIKSSKQNLIKVQSKIKSYFQQQGIPYNTNSDKINLQQLFQNYSKSLTQNAYQRYPQQRNQMTKIMESKYQKMVQVQRQQFQERIDQYKQELQLLQRQRDSYKNSTNAQQKQFSKLKQFTQKIVIKKADLQMQNSKTQEILKSVLDMMFAYLMNNISYQSLLQQIQATIQNIKVCLKYRQRQKQRQSKQSPMIDYRFSGLSAVSNDYSFSKLNKESYCDYFNEESEIEQESQVISKISSQDQVLPPSRPSYSTNNAPKRQLGMIDINQRATMANQDQSLLGYLNPVQIRTPRVQFQRNTVFLQSGLHDENIRTLQSSLGYLKNRIPQQTIQVEKQVELDAKQMYIKYKQALKCLQQAQKINQDNQVKYQNFMKELKEEGVFEAQQKVENKLFYMSKIIKEQEEMIEQQRIQFETTIAKKVIESEETMNLLMKNLNKSMSASRVVK